MEKKYTEELIPCATVKDLMENSLRHDRIFPRLFFREQGITENFLWNIKTVYPNTMGTYCISRVTNKPMEYFLTGKYNVPFYYQIMEVLDGISETKAMEVVVKLKDLISDK